MRSMLLPNRLLNTVLRGIKNDGITVNFVNNDWIAILEEMKNCLKSNLSTFANTPLGHVSLFGAKDRQPIKKDLLDVPSDPNNFSLSTPGFWAENYSFCANVVLPKESNIGTSTFWGITKKGNWAIVELKVQKIILGHTKGLETCRYKALEISCARDSDLPEIVARCERSYFNVWDSIVVAVHGWAKRREELAKEAMRVHESIEALNQIITNNDW